MSTFILWEGCWELNPNWFTWIRRDSTPFRSARPYGDVFPFNTRRDAVFSLEKIMRHTGYRSTPFETWMRKTIEWWKKTPHAHSNGYDRRREELEVAQSIKRETQAWVRDL